MKQLKRYICVLAVFALLFSSCDNWLEVEPKDKVREDPLYETEQGINSVVNGFYMGLAGEHLYGFDMTMSVTEALTHFYTYETGSPDWLQQVSQNNYDGAEAKNKFADIWKAYYASILNINTFLGKVDESTAVSQSKKEILKGEAHGLRAFLYFDLVRLFGPLYSADESSDFQSKAIIPYTQVGDGVVKPRISADSVLYHVEEDIKLAETYLANDPIITNGVQPELTNDQYTNFYLVRNKRMNYYAVAALKARVKHYQKDLVGAIEAADKVLAVAETIFPSTSREEYQAGDRIFSSEIIFGVYSQSIYTYWNDHFSSAVLSADAYKTFESNIKGSRMFNYTGDLDTYEDWRAWQWPVVSGRLNTRTSNKYEETLTHSDYAEHPARYFQPLIRIKEMYYIKAEALIDQGSFDDAAALINTVRRSRGLANVTYAHSKFNLDNELWREYAKEMFGEGQMFFWHKRRGTTYIPQPNSTSTISMSGKYVIPVPTTED